ncbi:MAG TPA: GDSL-type esterase/lipase family protein [Ktedonobacterales bacterium]|nr:GDSL-type esterase/lipase family protein [Ktedonobacterales bacterium]
MAPVRPANAPAGRRRPRGGFRNLLVLAAVGLVWAACAGPPHASNAGITLLAGTRVWRDGVSSLLFGTNDTYEWSARNIENQPDIQTALRHAGFSLVRTFIPDQASDATIDTRMATIERIGAQCLAVITNIQDATFNQHLVRALGNRCALYEFGNEPDLNGIASADYLRAWNTTIPLLRHINPRARFIGPVTSTDQGANGYLLDFLRGVKSSGVLPDAVSFHWYPCDHDTESACLAKASSYETVARGVRQTVRQVLGKDLPVGITEWNYDPGNPPPAYGESADFITRFTSAAIQSMARAGVAFACQFDAASYSGYGRLDLFNVETNQPKPQFATLAALIAHYRTASTPTTAATASPSRTPAAGALLSRGKPVYCSPNNSGPQGPGAVVDGRFGNWAFWQLATAALPGWCALHVGVGASQVVLAWFSDYNTDYLDDAGLSPQSYSIAVSADSTNGADGTWHTLVTVTDNQARAREHTLPFAGMSWVKLTIAAGQPHATQPYIRIDEIEVYDAAALAQASYIFSGDSITAMAYDRATGHLPAFADLVQTCLPGHSALTLDAGLSGWDSTGAAQQMPTWLALSPDVQYWLLGWGSNDALNDVAPATFRANLQLMVGAIIQAHRIPILARIPFSTFAGHPGLDAEIQSLNAVIDEVTRANQLLPGPDLYALFRDHPAYLLGDGLHPSDAGASAMNAAWFKVLAPTLTQMPGAPAAAGTCAG